MVQINLPSAFQLPKALAQLFHSSKPTTQQLSTPGQRLSHKLKPLQRPDRRLITVQARNLEDEIEHIEETSSKATLTGIWKKYKDSDLNTSMDEACDLVHLPFVLRQALKVLNTLEIDNTDAYFQTNIKAGGLMDVKERYPWSGEVVLHSRRDKRRGQHRGQVYLNDQEAPVIEVTWDEPYGGKATDTFVLSEEGDVLIQESYMKMAETGKETAYRTVYRRKH